MRKIGDTVARLAGRHLRKYVVPHLPHIVTPVVIGATASAGALALFFDLAEDIRSSEGVWRFDHDGLALGVQLRTPRRTALMHVVSTMARPDVMIYIGLASLIVAWCRPNLRSKGLLLAVSLAGGGSLIGIIKHRYARERPDPLEALVKEGTFSFPSGHSFISLCFYGILAFWWARSHKSRVARAIVTAASAGMIGLTGASRVYLGAHYPSDVLAGYAAATPWLFACLYAYARYERRVVALPTGPKEETIVLKEVS